MALRPTVGECHHQVDRQRYPRAGIDLGQDWSGIRFRLGWRRPRASCEAERNRPHPHLPRAHRSEDVSLPAHGRHVSLQESRRVGPGPPGPRAPLGGGGQAHRPATARARPGPGPRGLARRRARSAGRPSRAFASPGSGTRAGWCRAPEPRCWSTPRSGHASRASSRGTPARGSPWPSSRRSMRRSSPTTTTTTWTCPPCARWAHPSSPAWAPDRTCAACRAPSWAGGTGSAWGASRSPSSRASTGAGEGWRTSTRRCGVASSSTAGARASTTRATPPTSAGSRRSAGAFRASTPRCCPSAPTTPSGSCGRST